MISPTIQPIQTSLDPYTIYQYFLSDDDAIFLDSSKDDDAYSRYSLFGLHPFLTIKVIDGCLYEKKHPQTQFILSSETNIFTYLNNHIKKYKLTNTTDYPFIGGALGYFSYELGKFQHNIPSYTFSQVTLPESYFVFYDNIIIIDKQRHEGLITGLGQLEPAQHSVQKIYNQFQNIPKKTQSTSCTYKASRKFTSTFSRDGYMASIENMRQYMEDGHIYVANMTQTFHGPCTESGLSIYTKLRQLNPAPFSAHIAFDQFQVCCSSPERFIHVRNQHVQTRPIKGTVPRGITPSADRLNRQALENSEKDKAELLMIVDLERNDLSKVCHPHSVHVPELFKIEAFSSVYHLVSTVTGQLLNDKTAVDCLEATFPGGSITGAPKIRAMEIIEELEATSRQLYTGSIGYFGFDGNADFNIVIRSILLKDGHGYFGVGGGITYESIPSEEYQETLDKAKNLFLALDASFSIDACSKP